MTAATKGREILGKEARVWTCIASSRADPETGTEIPVPENVGQQMLSIDYVFRTREDADEFADMVRTVAYCDVRGPIPYASFYYGNSFIVRVEREPTANEVREWKARTIGDYRERAQAFAKLVSF